MKKFLKYIKKALNDILNFFLCFLQSNCKYSLKKMISYVFVVLIVYLAIKTDKQVYEYLAFLAALLGIREYGKSINKNNLDNNSPTV